MVVNTQPFDEIADRITLIVSSCDAYSDLWDPFFTVLQSEWDGLDRIQIVLNTESKSYSYDGLNIRTPQLYGENDKPSWTERLRSTLETVDTDYVITLLDDFFMMDKVDTSKIRKHIRWMDADKRVSVFSYMETFPPNIRDGRHESFERRPLVALYKFNCQAALWRKNRLISYLDHDESPWEWEMYGNWRSYRHPFHYFYSHIEGNPYVFPYIYSAGGINFGGLALYRGRWYLPYVQPLFEKYGIEMDFSIRGTITEDEIRKNVDIDGSCTTHIFENVFRGLKYLVFNMRMVKKYFL